MFLPNSSVADTELSEGGEGEIGGSTTGHTDTQPSLLRTLVAQSYNYYGMEAQDVLIMKIPILRQFDWSLLKY